RRDEQHAAHGGSDQRRQPSRPQYVGEHCASMRDGAARCARNRIPRESCRARWRAWPCRAKPPDESHRAKPCQERKVYCSPSASQVWTIQGHPEFQSGNRCAAPRKRRDRAQTQPAVSAYWLTSTWRAPRGGAGALGSMVIVPRMNGCCRQKYQYTPGSAKLKLKLSPTCRSPESQSPPSDVVVWTVGPAFVHVMVVPGGTATPDTPGL